MQQPCQTPLGNGTGTAILLRFPTIPGIFTLEILARFLEQKFLLPHFAVLFVNFARWCKTYPRQN
mgnify:CR=1 FL=1